MGTSKQQRKYKSKPEEPTEGIRYKVLINNHYFLDRQFESWEEAEQAGEKYTKGKRMSYVVVTGV